MQPRGRFVTEPPPRPPAPKGPGFRLVDSTATAGIDFRHNSGAFGEKYLPETLGAGCAFFDYDNDGWQDILLVRSEEHTSELQSQSNLVCRLLLEKKKNK